MFWIDLLIGVILIISGFLTNRHPTMISGVSTMSKKRQEKIDLAGLGRGFCIVQLLGGSVMLLLGGLSTLVHVSMGMHLVVTFTVLIAMLVACTLIMRKYDAGLQGEEGKKDRRKTLIGIIIAVVILVGVLFFFFLGIKPATIEVSDESITAKGGGYSAVIPMTEIETVNVLSHWPAISLRTNGHSTDKVNIGHFRLKDGESCMLFLCVDGGPVLEVRTFDGELYYLNCATEAETDEMISIVKAGGK